LVSPVQKNNKTKEAGSKHLRVLLVEDNDINRLYAQSILRSWQCETDVAENGLVAIERLKSRPYDVVLMDIQMPVMDGYEATRVIRLMSQPVSSVPIIALTANATKADVDRCLEAGMNDYLSKPFTPEDLYNKLFEDLKLSAATPTKPPVVESTLYDLDYLRNVSGNNTEFIQEMIQTFTDTMPVSIKRLEDAIANHNWEELSRVIHQIKPSLTLLGIHKLKDTAVILEEEFKKAFAQKKNAEQVESSLQILTEFIHLINKAISELKQVKVTGA
jgi:CheY-like chemotaxis protein